MPFIEATRSTAHDGSVHVHSEAYEKVKAFLEEYACYEENEEQFLQISARLSDARKKMLTALCEHYDGEIPDYVEFSSVILEIDEDGEVEVIRPRSYCDLYRIERAAAEADE
jgi:predicted patatin/cPLA2 family phospholipase